MSIRTLAAVLALLYGPTLALAQQPPGDAVGRLGYKQGEITFVMGSGEAKKWLLVPDLAGAQFLTGEVVRMLSLGEQFRKFVGQLHVAHFMFTPDGAYPRSDRPAQSLTLGVVRDYQTGELVVGGLDIMAPPDYPRAIYHKVHPMKCELRASVASNGAIQGSGNCEGLGEREPPTRFSFTASSGVGGRNRE